MQIASPSPSPPGLSDAHAQHHDRKCSVPSNNTKLPAIDSFALQQPPPFPIRASSASSTDTISEQIFERCQMKARRSTAADDYRFYMENRTAAMLENLKAAQFDHFLDNLKLASRRPSYKERAEYPLTDDEDDEDNGYGLALCILDESDMEEEARKFLARSISNNEIFRMDL